MQRGCTPDCMALVDELREEISQLHEGMEPPPTTRRLQEKLGIRLQEARLLAAFLTHGVRSREQLHAALYPDIDKAPESNSLTARISYLRKKLPPGSIKNIFGYGYQMSDETRTRMKQMIGVQ